MWLVDVHTALFMSGENDTILPSVSYVLKTIPLENSIIYVTYEQLQFVCLRCECLFLVMHPLEHISLTPSMLWEAND